MRLLWALYDEHGRVRATFRALDNRTLTNEQDEGVTLPDNAGQTTIGIVHPLELSLTERLGWNTHLADHKIAAPFTQLERQIALPKESERTLRISMDYQRVNVNGMSFRGQADRRGWQRGPVGDGGMVVHYRKRFLGAGVDAILELDGMPVVGADSHTTVTLGRLYFCKPAIVDAGWPVYEKPGNDCDPRLLCFGDVPPIVFSETMGDLARIAGTQQKREE